MTYIKTMQQKRHTAEVIEFKGTYQELSAIQEFTQAHKDVNRI